jgi:hypothetical protein
VARCTCDAGYKLSADRLACAPAAGSVLTYGLLWDDYPDWPLGKLALDMSDQVSGTLREIMSFNMRMESGGRGLGRSTRLVFSLDATGSRVTGLEYEDQSNQGSVSRRRWGQASLDVGSGTASFQRLDKVATVPLSYASPTFPLPMLGGFEYPGWTLGCFSPTFYTLALKRYDSSKKGAQSLDVLWPEAGLLSRVTMVADSTWTDQKPVLYFPDYDIKVTYQGDFPSLIHLEGEQLGWSLSEATPADLNLSERKTPTPVTAETLPTDLTETALTVTSADGTSLAGTLTRPAAQSTAVPGVLLLGDLLSPNRDAPFSRLPGMPLFRHLAAHLAHAGYASLRYDLRGRGASKGDAGVQTLKKLTEDGAAALAHLSASAGVDPGRVYLLSLGPGSVVALGLLPGSGVKGMVAVSPVVRNMEQVLVYHSTAHVKASGFSDKIATQQSQQVMDTVSKIKDGTLSGAAWNGLPPALWKELLAFDGTSALGAFTGPVLVLRGDQDLEVPTEQVLAAQDAAIQAGKTNLVAQSLPGITHTLTEGSIADLLETAVLPLTMPAVSLEAVLSGLTPKP